MHQTSYSKSRMAEYLAFVLSAVVLFAPGQAWPQSDINDRLDRSANIEAKEWQSALANRVYSHREVEEDNPRDHCVYRNTATITLTFSASGDRFTAVGTYDTVLLKTNRGRCDAGETKRVTRVGRAYGNPYEWQRTVTQSDASDSPVGSQNSVSIRFADMTNLLIMTFRREAHMGDTAIQRVTYRRIR